MNITFLKQRISCCQNTIFQIMCWWKWSSPDPPPSKTHASGHCWAEACHNAIPCDNSKNRPAGAMSNAV